MFDKKTGMDLSHAGEHLQQN